MGMTITKEIIPTKANVTDTDLQNFWVVHPNEFIYNPRTHGTRIGLGFNNTDKAFIISWNNIAFRVKKEMLDILTPEYLFMHFNRDEWDREACYQSWGTSTEVFTWDALCSLKLTLPSLSVQQKYVAVYKALQKNLATYENGLEDLKLTCDGFIDKIKNEKSDVEDVKHCRLGDLIELFDERNTDGKYTLDDVKGISIEKKFIETKADMKDVSLDPYILVKPDCFAYVTVTSRNGNKITLAHNDSTNTYIVSSSYIVFRISHPELLLSGYLSLLFTRSEFDRYARFSSWGSARETFDWNEMCDVKIPLPSIEIQQDIVNIYNVYIERQRIAAELRQKIKTLCPLLIKGSLEE
jgi:type I restriction enzyme, S subunit